MSFDDGTLRILSLLKSANDIPVTGTPYAGTQNQGLHSLFCSSFPIWSVQASKLTGMVAYCSADGHAVRFKEFLRLWFKDHCNPYEDKVLPDAPKELVSELAWRYIFLYETITKLKFEIPTMEKPAHDRITWNVSTTLASLL